MYFPLLLACLLGSAYTAPQSKSKTEALATNLEAKDKDETLIGAASTTYTRRYSDLNGFNSGYGGVTGHGIIDDRYNYYGNSGYDSGLGYSGYNGGFGGYQNGYNGYNGIGTYNSGYGGYKGYNGLGGYNSIGGYNGVGYNSGYGGYGGYGGNGGLNSYYGYNNPNYYQGASNLGYGYYKKSGFYGGVTPSLVTGYRGYTR